jgi:hypothetical protein
MIDLRSTAVHGYRSAPTIWQRWRPNLLPPAAVLPSARPPMPRCHPVYSDRTRAYIAALGVVPVCWLFESPACRLSPKTPQARRLL